MVVSRQHCGRPTGPLFAAGTGVTWLLTKYLLIYVRISSPLLCWPHGPDAAKLVQGPTSEGQVQANSRGAMIPLVYFASKRGGMSIQTDRGALPNGTKIRQTGGKRLGEGPKTWGEA